MAADESGYALTYALRLLVWSPPTDIDSTRAISDVTCTGPTFCVAVGASGYATTYNGTSWSTPADVDSTRDLDAVSCASSSFCVAVDTSGYATTYNGTSWSTPVRHRFHPFHQCGDLHELDLLRGRWCVGLRHHLQRHEVVDAH